MNHSIEADVQNSEAVDRISELPRHLRTHILGFLPLRNAVATTILSKKWKYAWIEVPTLDFTDLPAKVSDGTLDNQQCACFKDFVNRVLLLNGAPCLERVCFEAYAGLPSWSVAEWAIVLARRSMKELYLCNKVDGMIGLRSDLLFNKEQLVVLKLDNHFCLSLPSSIKIHLPQLKSLSITKLDFRDVEDPLSSIISNCPVLEELSIDKCEGFNMYSVESSSLKTLRIVSGNDEKETIIIKTPILEQVHLEIGLKKSSVCDLPSLVGARLEVWTSTVRWVTLLQRFCSLKTLVLYQIMLDGSNAVNQVPIFQNLTHLEVGFSSWLVVLQILRNAPSLTSFIIHKLMFDWPKISPRSVDFSLASIQCHWFDEAEEGPEILKFFLSNSKLLKKLKITMRHNLDSTSQVKILKMLLNIPRVSDRCKITVVSGDGDATSEDSDSGSEDRESDSMSDDCMIIYP